MAPASPLLSLPSMSADLARTERALLDAVRTGDELLTEMASHLIVAGGKRLRPVACMAAARAGGAPVTDEVVLGGVAVELVHLGSLYHDDVIDEAEVRRTVPSVNAKWGNLKAILSGDFLLARASEIAASLGTEVAALLARTISRLCEGEIGELRYLFQVDRPVEAYFAAIDGKTASLFSAACRIGAIVAGQPRERIDALTEYGTRLGMVFQIVDDILDVTATEAELGKPAGHDLVEGVYNLPVLLTLRHGGPASDELRDLLGVPVEGAELEKALSFVRSNGGVRESVAIARRFADEAVSFTEALEDNAARDALCAAPHALLDALDL